jgi:hypothetical protein
MATRTKWVARAYRCRNIVVPARLPQAIPVTFAIEGGVDRP